MELKETKILEYNFLKNDSSEIKKTITRMLLPEGKKFLRHKDQALTELVPKRCGLHNTGRQTKSNQFCFMSVPHLP